MIVALVANAIASDGWESLVVAVGLGFGVGYMLVHVHALFEREAQRKRFERVPSHCEFRRTPDGTWEATVTTFGGDISVVRLPEQFNNYDPSEDDGTAGFAYVIKATTGVDLNGYLP